MRNTRREMLKQVAAGAGCIGLAPFVSRLKAHAAGDPAQIPQRFVFVSCSNGVVPYGIQPQDLDDRVRQPGGGHVSNEEFAAVPLGDVTLNESMQALNPFKPKLNIIQGLSAKMCKGTHGAGFGAMGAYLGNEHDPPIDSTIDYVLSQSRPAAFPHLRLYPGPIDRFVAYPRVSAAGANHALPFYCNPSGAYRELFSTLVGGEQFQSEADLQRNLLDFVADDLRRLNSRLTSEEREKLDQYTAGVEALQDRQARIAALGDEARARVPEFTDKYTSEVEIHRLEAHFDMAAAALITGLTNTVTIRADQLDTTYTGLDIPINVHGVGHVEGDPHKWDEQRETLGITGVEARQRIRSLHFNLIGDLARKLDAIAEADGTMLDNTLIVFFSDAGSQHHANYERFPLVTLGNLGGRLQSGRYLHYVETGQENRRTTGNFYTALLHAAGMPQDGFGQLVVDLPEEEQKIPLPELLI